VRQGLGSLVCGLIASVLLVTLTSSVEEHAAGATVCKQAYSYAGLQGSAVVAGIRAELTVLTAPQVDAGHVAGWIGVGGPGLGPGGTDQWLQAGYSAFPDGTVQLYYEIALPRRAPEYHAVESEAQVGESRLIAIREVSGTKGAWRVWVGSGPVSPVYLLTASDREYVPQAIGESWRPSNGPCNAYAWLFHSGRVALRPGGAWISRGKKPRYEWHDIGYRVKRIPPDSFEASSR